MSGGAFLLKQLGQPLLPLHQPIDLRRLAVEKSGDDVLLEKTGHRMTEIPNEVARDTLLTTRPIHRSCPNVAKVITEGQVEEEASIHME